MDLIEIRREKLLLGMVLDYTLRDEKSAILLAKGHRIETAQQLDSIKSRGKIFVEIDESEEGVRAMMGGLATLNLVGAPIKDFSKHLNLTLNTQAEEGLTGTFPERWGTLESKLGGLLASVGTTADFEKKLHALSTGIQRQLAENSTGSQFLLVNRAVTHFSGYSVTHALLCATLVQLLADIFALTDDERRSLVCAALTMNVAMTRLQDTLTLQKTAVSAQQRHEIDLHAGKGRQILQAAGVTDTLWLDIVALHHSPLEGPEALSDWTPVQRMTKILQTVDRYTAAMSPRKSRSGRTARDSVRSVVVQPGTVKHDEVGTALVRILGVSPPGTFVKLANGETAVVLRRGVKPGEPWVASVLNRNDEPIAEPRLHNTAQASFAVQSTLIATAIRVNLKLDAMLKIIPR